MRKKTLFIVASLCFIVFAAIFTAIGKENSVPVIYKQGDKIVVKARGKEPVVLVESNYDYGYGYTTKNGVAFKALYGSCVDGEEGELHYVSLTSEAAKWEILEEDVDHVETTDELLVYLGKDLKIFDGEKAVTVDTEVDNFRITPDKRKILYWRKNGEVYVAKAATEPEPELIFNIDEVTYSPEAYFPDAYPVYCSGDLKQIVFNGGDDLYGYKNGKCKVISGDVSQAAVVKNTIYYSKDGKIYSYRNGKEALVDDESRMRKHYECRGYEDNMHSWYNTCFKKDKFIEYCKIIDEHTMETRSLMGSEKSYDGSGHIVCDGSYIYEEMPTNSAPCIERCNITANGFRCRKKLLTNVSDSYAVDSNKIVAENDKGTYIITGGKCTKLTSNCDNGQFVVEGNMVCWMSYDDTLYYNNRKLCDNVRYFKLRKDGSIVWLTKNEELYVKYKHCKPELIGESWQFYTMR